MNQLGALIRKDLLRRLHAPGNLILTLLFPLALVAVIGITFRPGDSVDLPPVKMLIENHDGEFIGKFLGSALQNEVLARHFDMRLVEPGEAENLTAGGKASAAIVIPDGFTDSLLAGSPTALTLFKNPGEVILPEIAEGFTDMLVLALSGASRMLREPLVRLKGMMDADANPSDVQVAAMAVAVNQVMQRGESLLLPPVIEVRKTERAPEAEEGGGEESGTTFNIFAFLFPGIVALGLLFVGQNAMRDLLQERELGQVDRLLASPSSMGAVIASKLLSTLALLVICHLLLAVAGRLVFGIRAGDPVASFLLVVCQGLAITGLMALIFSLTRTEKQAGALSTIVIFGMSIVGGSMIPTDALPGMAQKASPFTINYWAIDGFQKVMMHGGGVAGVAPHLAILAFFGLVTAVAGSLLFPRSLRR